VQQWSALRPREREWLTAAGAPPLVAHAGSLSLLAVATAAANQDRAQAAGNARRGHAAATAASSSSSKTEALCFTRYLPNPGRHSSSSSNGGCEAPVFAAAGCEWCKSALPCSSGGASGSGDHDNGAPAEAAEAAANAAAVGYRYCGWACAQAAALRSGSSTAIRRQVFALDRGVCALCGVDAHAHFMALQTLAPPERLQRLLSPGPFRSLLSSGGGRSASKKAHGGSAAAPRVVTQPAEADFWQVRFVSTSLLTNETSVSHLFL
jgi:hypothetical protein